MDKQQMYGKVRIIIKDEKKKVIEERNIGNAIVNKGRELLAKLLIGNIEEPGIGAITHMAIGSGGNETVLNMLALEDEKGLRSVLKDIRVNMAGNEALDGDEAQIEVEATFSGDDLLSEGENVVFLREAGLFTGENDGIMYNRIVFDEIPLRRNIEITLQWKVCFPPPISQTIF